MAASTADLLVERLADWGVDTVFGFPGDGINGIFEALRTHQKRVRFIQVRHEEAAAFDVAAYNQRDMGPAHVVNVVDEAMGLLSRSE